MNTPLVKEFTYHASAPDVWKALVDPASMRRWYFPQLRKFEPVVGFRFQFNDGGSPFQKEWLVTRVEAEKTLAHSWTYGGHPGTSEVCFDLFENGNQTTLLITQTGLESFPNHPHFGRERFEQGWNTLLGVNLKALLEEKLPS